MNKIKAIVRVILRYVLALISWPERRKMKIRGGNARWLAEAVSESLWFKPGCDEKQRIDAIENFRKNLETSAKTINVIDYGAGDSKSSRSDEEMYNGVSDSRVVGSVCRSASKPAFWALILYKIIIKSKPSNCVELGTCLGISAMMQAAALKINEFGQLVSLEGSPELAELSAENLSLTGYDNVQVVCGRFSDTFAQVLNQLHTVDYAFIDGHHDEKATLQYFETILPFLSESAVLVFDDISWSDGMRRAWNQIKKHSSVAVSLDLRQMGICVIGSQTAKTEHYKITLI
ncbi:MAG TPA: class I SAM-dependent methyltransferase [Bacteroidales bacterium]|nr:class I SAM-dependent methyltransferase [Bacteroidales bacterium]HOE03587.1 class I SAM-dependent methyltransferase [Bacteroidales bacterium]